MKTAPQGREREIVRPRTMATIATVVLAAGVLAARVLVGLLVRGDLAAEAWLSASGR